MDTNKLWLIEVYANAMKFVWIEFERWEWIYYYYTIWSNLKWCLEWMNEFGLWMVLVWWAMAMIVRKIEIVIWKVRAFVILWLMCWLGVWGAQTITHNGCKWSDETWLTSDWCTLIDLNWWMMRLRFWNVSVEDDVFENELGSYLWREPFVKPIEKAGFSKLIKNTYLG